MRYDRVIPLGLSVFAVAAIVACADFSAPAPPEAPDVAVANPSFRTDIQPIFTARCATSGCHNEATHQMGVDLAEGYAYQTLVNVKDSLVPTYVRVKPSDPDSSFLVHMITPGDSVRQAFNIPQMPLALRPLTNNQIGNIVRWIQQGAQNN